VGLRRITCLAGGVGAARFLQGLVRVVPEESVTVVVNTGDDVELYGLHVSPDVDIVSYTLAGIVDESKGWGIEGDTFNFLDQMARLGQEAWFKIGDRDLATHVLRTRMLREGMTLSQATREITRMLGLRVNIIPMTDDPFTTVIRTEAGELHFQEWLVKRGGRDRILGIEFRGAEKARPAPGVLEALEEADWIIVCPSNPIVSIGTILSVKGVRETLRNSEAVRLAISPIIGGKTVKGPADVMMRALGVEATAYGVAWLYRDFLDVLVMDKVDRELKERVEGLGIRVHLTDTIMRGLEGRVRLAREVVRVLEGCR